MQPRIEQRILFPPNNIIEEVIFTTRNLDLDCETIGQLLYKFSDMFILSALEDTSAQSRRKIIISC